MLSVCRGSLPTMPRTSLFGKNAWSVIQKWSGPCLAIVLGLLAISVFVSGIRCIRNEMFIEQFTEQPKVAQATLEKAKHLLPHLSAYLLGAAPNREWTVAVADDDIVIPYHPKNYKKHHKEKDIRLAQKTDLRIWEDLSGHKRDFVWQSGPSYNKHDESYQTQHHILLGPRSSEFQKGKQLKNFSLSVRAKSLAPQNKKKGAVEPLTTGELIMNAEYDLMGKKCEMSIQVPPHYKKKYEAVKDMLSDKTEKNGNNLKNLTLAVASLTTDLNKEGTKARKPPCPPIAISFSGNQGKTLEMRIPQSTDNNGGYLEVEIAGKTYRSKYPVLPWEYHYYTVVYSHGSLDLYVDKTNVGSWNNVHQLYFGDNTVQVNPTGDWDAAIDQLAILNYKLEKEELALLQTKNLLLRAILDKHKKDLIVPGMKPDAGCVCVGSCRCPGMAPFNPYEPHPKISYEDGVQCECKAACACPGKPVYDPYDPTGTVSQDLMKELKYEEKTDYSKCPYVFKNDKGDYIVVTYGGDGKQIRQSYGKDRSRARKIYRYNFPNCSKLPDILSPDRPPDWGNCPFVVRSKLNPCFASSCENANWDARTPREAHLSKGCRRRVNAYCEEFPSYDDFCACWRPEYQNLPECKKFRSKFEPHNDDIDISIFNIEDHPDMNKYIRKDRIPCFGCDLTSASGKPTCEEDPSGPDCDLVEKALANVGNSGGQITENFTY